MRQSGNALRKLIRSVAAAGLWSGGVGKDQERYASRKSQSGTGGKAAWDGLLIGPGFRADRGWAIDGAGRGARKGYRQAEETPHKRIAAATDAYSGAQPIQA